MNADGGVVPLRRVREAADYAFDLHTWMAKVHQQTKVKATGAKIIHALGTVHGVKCTDCLQLNDQ